MIVLFSCSHIESGQYIELTNNDTLSSLSKEFNVPAWKIEDLNSDKRFVVGEFVFIPSPSGILRAFTSRGPSSARGIKSSGEFMWPVPSSRKISSPFGKRWGRRHNGIDISARPGSHILASNGGAVIYSGSGFGGFGNIIILAHRYGYFTIYAHNRKNYVKKGEKVHKGQVIAQIGNTGRSTGAHLHFEIRRNSKPIDPVSLLSRSSSRMIANNKVY